MAAACAVFATPTPASAQSVKDYVEGLPNNSNIGRTSTNALKDPVVDSLPSGTYRSGSTVTVTGNNVVLENWDFDGYTVTVKGVDCIIRNCVLGEDSGVSGRWTYIDVYPSATNLLVEHNDILGYAGEGGASQVINHRTSGSGTSIAAAENITIRYNLFDNMQADAIKIAGDGALIAWNAFTDQHNLKEIPQPWSSSKTYNIGDYALNAGDAIFRSKINNNNYEVPVDRPYNWKSDRTYYQGQPAKNGNGTIFLSKSSGNKGNAIPSTSSSNAHWQLYDHWGWYDPHCDHITMLAAPGFLTIKYNYFARPDRSRLVTGMNNAIRLSRNTGNNHLVEDVLLEGNYLEENTTIHSYPVHINKGGQGNFNGPFTLRHGWYGKNKTGKYIYPHSSEFVTAYWDNNHDNLTNAAIPTPANFTTQSTTPPGVSVVPSVIVNGHNGSSGGGSVPTGVVTIRNRDFNQYLDSDSNGAVDLNNSATGEDRQWDIIPVGDGVHYWIDNMKAGRNNLYFDSGPGDVRYWDNHYNGDWTMWKIESVGGGYYVLTNKADGGKLDGDSGNNVDLSYVGNDRHDVQWTIVPVGGGSDVGVTISATLFDAESHPGDNNRIRIASSGENIGWIKEGNWVRFDNFDFGSGASSCTVEASSGGSGGRIEFRLGSATGTLIGSIDVTSNGNWGDYRTLSTNSITNESNDDLYLVFEKINNNNGDLMNLKSFKFE